MTTATDLQKAIATNEQYAANYTKAGKNPAKYLAKIAALKAELAAFSAPKAAAPLPVPATGGPLTQAHIDAAYATFTEAAKSVLVAKGGGSLTPQEIHDIAVANGVVRDIAAMGLLGDPGTFPDVDYSGYTHYDADENTMRVWVAGKLVATAPVSTDVLGWANVQVAKYGVKF
jgi:hypothetical protein